MKLVRASWLVCSVLLGACQPEVVELVVYGRDGAIDSPDTGARDEPELDANTEPVRDASTSSNERDARARNDAEGDAGRGGCSSKSDCGPQETCSFTGCGSKRGTCVSLPNNCGAEPSKSDICGCDGYKYFNECVRLQKGATLDPSCSMQHPPCDANQPCAPLNGETTYCSRVVTGRTMCGRSGQQERVCYVMPSSCFVWEADYYSSCEVFPGTNFELCYGSLCDAIKSSADAPKSFTPLWRTTGSRCGAFINRMGGGPGGGGFPGGGFSPPP